MPPEGTGILLRETMSMPTGMFYEKIVGWIVSNLGAGFLTATPPLSVETSWSNSQVAMGIAVLWPDQPGRPLLNRIYSFK